MVEFLTEAISVLRFGLYIFIAVECMSIFILYKYGYQRHAPSPIIKALSNIFLFSGIFFVVASLLPLANSFRGDLYTLVSISVLIMGVFMVIFLDIFRTESMKDQKKNVPISKGDKNA